MLNKTEKQSSNWSYTYYAMDLVLAITSLYFAVSWRHDPELSGIPTFIFLLSVLDYPIALEMRQATPLMQTSLRLHNALFKPAPSIDAKELVQEPVTSVEYI